MKKKSLQGAAYLMPAFGGLAATYLFAESQRGVKAAVILIAAALGLALVWVASRTR